MSIIGTKDIIQTKIHTIRGLQVMLDRDLAELYDVKPIRLREQVKRNAGRFPSDFMFQLNEVEVDLMVSQNAIPSRKHLGGTLPFVFTEQGVAGISGILTSLRAIEIHVAIMRAIVEMRRVLAASGSLLQRMDNLEKRQVTHESKTDAKFDQVFAALESATLPNTQGIFFDGQIFDAYVFVNDLLRQAKASVVLIDNYIDDSVLLQLTKTLSERLRQDLRKHNAQYPEIHIHEFSHSHDRFLILDGHTVYHIGASLKDLGKKWFAFSKLDKSALSIMDRVQTIVKESKV